MGVTILIDENLSPELRKQLLRHSPDWEVFAVGNPDAPPKATLDPDILRWCASHNAVLITNNRKSMPGHLREFEDEGLTMPGILLIDLEKGFGRALDLIREAFEFPKISIFPNDISYL